MSRDSEKVLKELQKFLDAHAEDTKNEADADAHEGCQAHRRAGIVGEAQEGAGIGDDAAMQRHAVHGCGHRMFADAVIDVAAGRIGLGRDYRKG